MNEDPGIDVTPAELRAVQEELQALGVERLPPDVAGRLKRRLDAELGASPLAERRHHRQRGRLLAGAASLTATAAAAAVALIFALGGHGGQATRAAPTLTFASPSVEATPQRSQQAPATTTAAPPQTNFDRLPPVASASGEPLSKAIADAAQRARHAALAARHRLCAAVPGACALTPFPGPPQP